MGQLTRWLNDEGLHLSVAQRATHTHVIGQPGTGKSRALESWIIQDIAAGRGVGVLDPHGDLYQNLVFIIAEMAVQQPKLAERVILLDPNQPLWTVGFNPLEPIRGISQERLAWFLTDVIIKIWKIDAASAPRMLRLLTYTFLTLSEFRSSLVDLPRFLTDEDWRDNLVARTKHREVVDYFRYEFPTTPAAIQQWITPVLNKIGPLIFDPDVRLMLAAGSTINFRKIIDQKSVLLVNLAKGILGEGSSALLGAFIMAHLQQAALSRADSRQREPFFLYLDEFQSYTTDNIKDILAESRKYGLSLVLAHQYLNQLAEDLRGAVLNTAGTVACFRLGYHDAALLAREIFPPGVLQRSRFELKFARAGRYRMPYFREKKEELSHEALGAFLTQLRPREFWTKRRGAYEPVKQRTLDMPEPPLSPELFRLRKELVESSGQRYGRLKAQVREELKRERGNGHQHSTSYYEPAS